MLGMQVNLLHFIHEKKKTRRRGLLRQILVPLYLVNIYPILSSLKILSQTHLCLQMSQGDLGRRSKCRQPISLLLFHTASPFFSASILMICPSASIIILMMKTVQVLSLIYWLLSINCLKLLVTDPHLNMFCNSCSATLCSFLFLSNALNG